MNNRIAYVLGRTCFVSKVYVLSSVLMALNTIGCSREFVGKPSVPDQQFSADRAGLTAGVSWWESFNQPILNQLMKRVFDGNLAMKQAEERALQLIHVAKQVGSQRFPNVNLEAGWSRNKQLNPFARLSNGPQPPGGGLPTSFEQDNYRLSLAVSYEIDLFGRISSLVAAAERDAIAMEHDRIALGINLSAQVVEGWLTLIEIQERRALLIAQIDNEEALLTLSQSRYEEGLSPRVEYLQQLQQRDRTKANLPLLNAQEDVVRRQLALALGKTTLSNVQIPDALPDLPAAISLGLPSKVLLNRPDIISAQARLTAADSRVSAALSARYPALRIGASAGVQSFEPAELFEDMIWGLSTNILAPIFQAGRLNAEQKRQEAVLRERLHALNERLIIAYHEVENALTNEEAQRTQLTLIQAQLDSALALEESALERYLDGVGDFQVYLAARQGSFAARLAQLNGRRSILSHRIALYRSIAGSIPEDGQINANDTDNIQ